MAFKKQPEKFKIGDRHVTPSFKRDAGAKGPTGSPKRSDEAKSNIFHASGQGLVQNKNPNEGKVAHTAQTGRVQTKRPGATVPPSQKPAARRKKKL